MEPLSATGSGSTFLNIAPLVKNEEEDIWAGGDPQHRKVARNALLGVCSFLTFIVVEKNVLLVPQLLCSWFEGWALTYKSALLLFLRASSFSAEELFDFCLRSEAKHGSRGIALLVSQNIGVCVFFKIPPLPLTKDHFTE